MYLCILYYKLIYLRHKYFWIQMDRNIKCATYHVELG